MNSNSNANPMSGSFLALPYGGSLTNIGPSTNRPKITPEELVKHNTEHDGWICVDGMVFDVSTFMYRHPGGPRPIMRYLGTDCSEAFHHITGHMLPHSIQRLQECYIGDLDKKPGSINVKVSKVEPVKIITKHNGTLLIQPIIKSPATISILAPPASYPCTVESISPISPDTAIVSFRLQTGYSIPMAIGLHVTISHTITTSTNEEVTSSRSYTPIAIAEGGTLLRFVIKQYITPQSFSRFIISQRKALPEYILKKGTSTDSPPSLASFTMSHTKGSFNFSHVSSGRFDRILMICAGTGVAPMYQICHKIVTAKFRRPSTISFISVNKTAHDSLLSSSIDELTYCQCDPCKEYRKSSISNGISITSSAPIAAAEYPPRNASEGMIRKLAVTGTRACVSSGNLALHTQLQATFILTREHLAKPGSAQDSTSPIDLVTRTRQFTTVVNAEAKNGLPLEANLRVQSAADTSVRLFSPGTTVVLGKPNGIEHWQSLVPSCLVPTDDRSGDSEHEWTLALLCGPDQFCDDVEGLLKIWGYSNSVESQRPGMNISQHCYFRF